MVLRSDRRIPPTTAEPGAVGTTQGFTVADVGRLLSRERNRQGLSLQDVGARTGIPVDQLRSAETGALERPDGLATLKTVRRYADFLGLPGDRFALAILERWPTKAGPRPFGPPASPGAAASTSAGARAGGPQLTGPTAGIAGLGPLTVPDTPAQAGGASHAANGAGHPDGFGHPETERDDTTQLVEAVGAAGVAAGQGDEPTYWGAYSDTGVTPAVLAPASQVWRRPRRSVPMALQALVVLVTLAVLAGVALLAVDRLKPSWLRAVGITHGAPSPTSPAGPPATSPAATHATSSGVLHPRTRAGGAFFVVRAKTFTAKLTSPGGPCWVQVSTNTSSAPTYAGMIDAGASRTFSHVRSLVVELASTAGRLSITSSGGHVSSYAPNGAYPFKITVHTKR